MFYESQEERRERREQEKLFLEGLERFRRRGIPIFIDGREMMPRDYGRLFVCEGRNFYMGDYVPGADGKLKEIRFDRVHL